MQNNISVLWLAVFGGGGAVAAYIAILWVLRIIKINRFERAIKKYIAENMPDKPSEDKGSDDA